MRPLFWALVWAVGCRKPPPPTATQATPVAAQPSEPGFAGRVADGVFEDRRGGFRIAVPDGWHGYPGRDGASLRLTLEHGDTGARVLVWRRPGGGALPVDREGCRWTFSDFGPYKTLRVADEVGVGSCRLADARPPAEAFAWVHVADGVAWQLEVHASVERLVESVDAGEAVLGTARWEAPR